MNLPHIPKHISDHITHQYLLASHAAKAFVPYATSVSAALNTINSLSGYTALHLTAIQNARQMATGALDDYMRGGGNISGLIDALTKVNAIGRNLPEIHIEKIKLQALIQASAKFTAVETEIEEPTKEGEEFDVRKALFAVYDGQDYLAESQQLNEQLDKVPDFDSQSIEGKIDTLLSIAKSSSSTRFGIYCEGVATSIIATALWEASGNDWSVLGILLVIVFCFLTARAATPALARKQFRRLPCKPAGLRSTICQVPVYNSGKHRRKKVMTLEPNTLVETIEKRSGWIEICLAGKEESIGWAQSKYLIRV